MKINSFVIQALLFSSTWALQEAPKADGQVPKSGLADKAAVDIGDENLSIGSLSQIKNQMQ